MPTKKSDVITAKDVKKVKQITEKAAKNRADLSAGEIKKFNEILTASKMPVELKDDDIKLGEGEIDVRKLSKENWRQLKWRTEIIQANHLRDISQTLQDIVQLLMVLLTKNGVENFQEAITDTLLKVQREAEELKKNAQ